LKDYSSNYVLLPGEASCQVMMVMVDLLIPLLLPCESPSSFAFERYPAFLLCLEASDQPSYCWDWNFLSLLPESVSLIEWQMLQLLLASYEPLVQHEERHISLLPELLLPLLLPVVRFAWTVRRGKGWNAGVSIYQFSRKRKDCECFKLTSNNDRQSFTSSRVPLLYACEISLNSLMHNRFQI
jgi:hypothetical protein